MSTFDPIDLSGNERNKAEIEAKKRIVQEVEDQDMRWLVSSKRGRRMVWRFLERSGVFRLSFNTNAMQMSFNEGHRNFGNAMLADVNRVSPECFSLMMRESKEALNGRDSDGSGKQSN